MGSDSGGACSAAEQGRRIVLATNNAKKIAEIESALDFPGWSFVSATSLDPAWPSPVEDGLTFEDNARIKARAAHERFGCAALADDSGLEVDELGGDPGVYSSRYAGETATDADNNARLLRELEGVPSERRAARFRCVLVLIEEDGAEVVVSGACEGQIGFEPHGAQGFGYDPLFLPSDTPGLTMAQLDMSQKNAISHRGAALRALRDAVATQE